MLFIRYLGSSIDAVSFLDPTRQAECGLVTCIASKTLTKSGNATGNSRMAAGMAPVYSYGDSCFVAVCRTYSAARTPSIPQHLRAQPCHSFRPYTSSILPPIPTFRAVAF